MSERMESRARRVVRRSAVVSIFLWSVLAWTGAAFGAGDGSKPLHPGLDRVAVPFVENGGQAPDSVRFLADTFGGSVSVMRDGSIVNVLRGADAGAGARATRTITERLRGAATISPRGDRPAPTNVSYIHGTDPSAWRSRLRTYERVDLGEAWPGIGVSLRAHGRTVEKIFTVDAGAEARSIRIEIAEAGDLAITPAGELRAATPAGAVVFSKPIAYQEIDASRRPVEVAYRLLEREYGFALGPHDASHPVVIDPFLQATYVGGTGGDEGLAMTLDPGTGELLIAGGTLTPDVPGAAEIFEGGPGRADVFVARLSADLTALLQLTYYGSGQDDVAFAIAVHPTTGNVYFGGRTRSQLPGLAGGAQPERLGSQSGFVAVLDSSLTTLVQSTYLGGTGWSIVNALAVHPVSGDVYAVGWTEGTSLPGTASGAQPAPGGVRDAFVVRLNAGLSSILAASYLGGPESDEGQAVAIAPGSGDIYIAGDAAQGLPFTTGGAQTAVGPDVFANAFVARFDAALGTAQATYVSGSNGSQLRSRGERGGALTIHPVSGDVYVAGLSRSDDHPGVVGGAQGVKASFEDAFVTRLDPTLATIVQSTYFGGLSSDDGMGLGLDPATRAVYLIGRTNSPDLPGVSCGSQTGLDGTEDGYVARLHESLTLLSASTYLGGSALETPFGGAAHPVSGEIYVVGNTSSDNFPATAGGAKSVPDNTEAFAIRLTIEIPGDCNGDGFVSIAELIAGVNIALGGTPLAACPAFDTNGDDTVSVAELIRAVNVALTGCP